MEKVFRKAQDELIITNEEMTVKLKNSVNIANDFKEKIIADESSSSDLSTQIAELKSENRDLRTRIEECLSLIQQLEGTYNEKIIDFEAFIESLQLEAQASNERDVANYERIAE